MADITEPKRISEQLAAAHERFTAVLESLDAAVSVVADDRGDELLFANRSYRDLYGSTPAGHRRLRAMLPQNAVAGEAFDAEVSRWFDVRTRDVRWVDGRDVRLQIATDITERKATESMVRQQKEVWSSLRAYDDGRDGVILGARAESAADSDQQLQFGRRVAHEGWRRVERRVAAGAGKDRRPSATSRQHHSTHP